MRIAMLSYHTCPLATLGGKDTGGMNVYVRELTKSLGKAGIHVDVFTRSQDEHVPHILHDLGYGNRVIHVRAGPEVPVPKQNLAQYLPEFVDGILAYASQRQWSYDIIHSHYWLSGIAGKQLKEQWRLPMVQMFHTLGEMKQRIGRSPEEREGAYRLEGERQVIRAAERIVAATPAELAQLQWLYQADPQRIEIIPPGVDVGHFYPIAQDEAKEVIGIPGEDRMLLFVGRIEPLKGVDTLIEAMSILREGGFFRNHPACLSVIGGNPEGDTEVAGSEMGRLKELRTLYHVEDLVAFLGKRGQDTLPYYYSAAEAVVVPSLYESFGMVALEAMACGTPVVASQVGGLAFLVQDGETGFTVPVDAPQVMAEKLALLLTDAPLRQAMGRRAAEFAQMYAWDIIASKMVDLYQEVLRETKSQG